MGYKYKSFSILIFASLLFAPLAQAEKAKVLRYSLIKASPDLKFSCLENIKVFEVQRKVLGAGSSDFVVLNIGPHISFVKANDTAAFDELQSDGSSCVTKVKSSYDKKSAVYTEDLETLCGDVVQSKSSSTAQIDKQSKILTYKMKNESGSHTCTWKPSRF